MKAMYRVKYYDHVSDMTYTKKQAESLALQLNNIYLDCDAHVIEDKEVEK